MNVSKLYSEWRVATPEEAGPPPMARKVKLFRQPKTQRGSIPIALKTDEFGKNPATIHRWVNDPSEMGPGEGKRVKQFSRHVGGETGVAKSFINGVWKPITSVPKKDFIQARNMGMTGEEMLKNNQKQREHVYNNLESISRRRGHEVERDTPWEGPEQFKHPLADKAKAFHLTSDKEIQHPTVFEHGGKKYAKGLDKPNLENFMANGKFVNDRTEAASQFGAGTTKMGAEDIVAHEAAHARPTRRKLPFYHSRKIRALERGIKETSDNPPPHRDTYNQNIEANAKKHWAGLQTREEAHADVLASQHRGKPVLSSHWKEPGYLEDRNMIARGMKQPELKNISFKRQDR